MALKKISFVVDLSLVGKRLDQCLFDLFAKRESLSKSQIRKLIVCGAVYLNQKRVRIASKTLHKGARIDVFLDLEKLQKSIHDFLFQMTEKNILYEDKDLIVVNKPPGLPTQPTLDEARNNLFESVKKFLQKREGAAVVYLGLHHRLDRDTSGVLLFTKTKNANKWVSELFSKHEIQKTYLAITSRPTQLPPNHWVIKNYLKETKLTSKIKKMASIKSGGLFAETHFTIKKVLPQELWIEAKPKTGRMHQIRVHLAEQGLPIYGDTLYGGAPAKRSMLHAQSLRFFHTSLQKEVFIESPLPEGFS